jgi:hypothetical protein
MGSIRRGYVIVDDRRVSGRPHHPFGMRSNPSPDHVARVVMALIRLR